MFIDCMKWLLENKNNRTQFKDLFTFILYVFCFHFMFVQCPISPEEGVGSPGTGVGFFLLCYSINCIMLKITDQSL